MKNIISPKSELEKELFKSVENKTPDYIKERTLIDIDNENAFSFRLKKEHLMPYDEKTNPEGLDLYKWLANYKKEAEVSTAGVRGPQNILYPEDTRFPINMLGITLATLGKALAAKERYKNKELVKIAAREVRYNSPIYLELISRIQAAQGIKTIVTYDDGTIPIWMTSFLTFVLDLVGGEYITSSHGISVKNATKDLNSQGSQYLPDESMEFVNQIFAVFKEVEEKGFYDINFSAKNDTNITRNYMSKINNGVDLYVDYLKNGVANSSSIDLIKSLNNKIVIENVGGSAYKTLSKILEKLNIAEKYDWLNREEDAFFHCIGKYDHDPKGNCCFYDYSVDATVVSTNKEGYSFYPVINSLHYDEKLKYYPIGTAIFITDPDHDRLTVTQIESCENISLLNELGIDYILLTEDKILAVYTANQSFLLTMDFWLQELKKTNKLNDHPRFIIKTTASARSWDEWAKYNGVKIVNVPVGFKEIANIMKKVEKQIEENPNKDVIITDVFGNDINLGINPRMLFGGEESGGMIIGAEDFIISKNGRKAIAMREKSASEAIIVTSSLIAELAKENKTLSEKLNEIFEKNNIISKYDVRVDISYYNESEPDIEKLMKDKIAGEELRTKNDLYYLTMALACSEGKITLDDIKTILSEQFKELDFSNLINIKFVGDGTYLEFTDKFIEIRPSGTDAKTKAYGAGNNKESLKIYAKILGTYSGELSNIYKRYISKVDYDNAKENSMQKYLIFTNKDANNKEFEIPDYSSIL